MQPLLQIDRLSVAFATSKGTLTALEDVTFSIQAGETVCLVGESGSGKTITSKAVMRLLEQENGKITVGDINLGGQQLVPAAEAELRRLRGKKMAMIFQEPMAAFDPVYTIGHQLIETILSHEQVSRKEARQRAIHLLERVGIPEPQIRLKQYPGELSGGMLQRAMIAMALSCSPELLIADEPTTALDVTIQAQILRLLQDLQQEFNMAILLITHDLGIASALSDRIIVMYAGKIVEQAETRLLFEKPLHPYTQGLLASIASPGQRRSDRLFSIKGSIPGLSERPAGCLFHPRCLYATDRCRREAPPLVESEGREVACWNGKEAERGDGGIQQEISLSVSARSEQTIERRGDAEARDLFQVRNLSKFYPVKGGLPFRPKTWIRAVDDVSFSIRQGETLGLVGESGSGKSTLGRVLLQLEQASSGSVLFRGRELKSGRELRTARRDMQMIFQDPYGSLDSRWTLEQIIGEPLAVHESLSGPERRERVEELLTAVGLAPSFRTRYPHEFSGGQRQRIAIARAIALNPAFVLADEAVSALDVSVQAQVVNLLQELQHKLGLTYLFIGHGLPVVRHIADRIGVMYLGKLVEIAPSEQLFERPAHPYTRGLIESIPYPDPALKKGFAAIQGEIPSPANPPAGCRFHPRCPLATARCREEEPQLAQIGSDHAAACHYPG